MIPATEDTHPETNGTAHVPESPDTSRGAPGNRALPEALELAADVAARYGISALDGLLESVRGSAAHDEIAVAVLGRFKAGKSSFLNHFLGRAVLPVGVVPVTAVVTEIRYGARDEARVYYRDGRGAQVPIEQIGGYIAEKENPRNVKQAGLITVALPELLRFRGLRFVDTPGLDSALAHNTQTSLDWLPKVGLALVAVSVDPPLSARDVELLKSLYQYTPKVAILLTKADLLSERELAEVVAYVGTQLALHLPEAPRVFPYSTKPGFERFRDAVEAELAGGTLERFAEERESIVIRKLETLLRECGDYLALSLKSAEMAQSERQALERQVAAEKEIAGEVKSTVRLVVQHAAGGTRATVSQRLEAHQGELERALIEAFAGEFPKWSRSLGAMLSSFEDWLGSALRDELTTLSVAERTAFLEPLDKVRKQVFRVLQQFRDRLSDRTMQVLGVPLRTTETEIGVVEPRTPDIRIGRVFDRNWELLSPLLPVWAIRAVVRHHFARTISYLVYENLSRAGAQWEESVNGALWGVEKEARRRLDELMGTVERLVAGGGDERTPQLRTDIERLDRARESLTGEAASRCGRGETTAARDY
jgi:GTP-binding protein EngB required for normal cell division